jgi:hypothetical protein
MSLGSRDATSARVSGGSINAKRPSEAFDVSLPAGSLRADLAFSKCSQLGLDLRNVAGSQASMAGPSVVHADLDHLCRRLQLRRQRQSGSKLVLVHAHGYRDRLDESERGGGFASPSQRTSLLRLRTEAKRARRGLNEVQVVVRLVERVLQCFLAATNSARSNREWVGEE